MSLDGLALQSFATSVNLELEGLERLGGSADLTSSRLCMLPPTIDDSLLEDNSSILVEMTFLSLYRRFSVNRLPSLRNRFFCFKKSRFES